MFERTPPLFQVWGRGSMIPHCGEGQRVEGFVATQVNDDLVCCRVGVSHGGKPGWYRAVRGRDTPVQEVIRADA